MNFKREIFEKTLRYRSMMGLSLSEEDVKYIWGKKFLKSLDRKDISKLKVGVNNNVGEKILFCKKELKKLLVFNWVKFIAISGSVSAGFAKKEDDIDVFVVVKNDRMWLYRGVLAFTNLFHNRIRAKRHKDVKDKFCVNLIAEERGLLFEEDIFNFHELMFLIPVYNEEYKRFVYSKNKWLRKKFYVKKELLNTRELVSERKNPFLYLFNRLAFLLQYVFMFISGHNPERKRLVVNNELGKIEFFEDEYKREVLEQFYNSFKSIS